MMNQMSNIKNYHRVKWKSERKQNGEEKKHP